MTEIERSLIYTMLKNKYSGKYIREVFPDIILPNTKFDDLQITNKCLCGGTWNLIHVSDLCDGEYFVGNMTSSGWKEFNIYDHISDIVDLI